MPKFTLDERKSEYSPIIVDIRGKEFTVRDFDKNVLRELNKFDQEVEKDLLAPYRRLAFLLKLKENNKIFDGLHPREVNRMTNWIIRVAYSPDEAEMENLTPDEKKKKSNGAKEIKQ